MNDLNCCPGSGEAYLTSAIPANRDVGGAKAAGWPGRLPCSDPFCDATLGPCWLGNGGGPPMELPICAPPWYFTGDGELDTGAALYGFILRFPAGGPMWFIGIVGPLTGGVACLAIEFGGVIF